MKLKSGKEKEKPNFFKHYYEHVWQLIKAKLTPTAYRLVELICASDTFTDGLVFIPSVKKLIDLLEVCSSSIYNAINLLRKKISFIKIEVTRLAIIVSKSSPGDSEKNFFNSENLEIIPKSKNHFQVFVNDSNFSKTQQPESLPFKASDSPQTVQTVQTLQTAEGVNQKINKEIASKNNESAVGQQQKNSDRISPPISLKKTKSSEAVLQKKYDIPDDLTKRLEIAGIPITEQLKVKISQHHISQAYGAITHIENSAASIRDPKAVFLFQIPKQPIEKLGNRYSDELLIRQKKDLERIEQDKKNPEYKRTAGIAIAEIKRIMQKKVNPERH